MDEVKGLPIELNVPTTVDKTTPTQIEKPKHAGGRPTAYKQEYCELLIEHMSKGYSMESFAAKIETHRDTLYEWNKVYPEFSDAVRRGKAKSLLFWEAIGIQGTVGKLDKFSAGGFALNMANKHNWRDKKDVTSDDKKIEFPVVHIPEEVD